MWAWLTRLLHRGPLESEFVDIDVAAEESHQKHLVPWVWKCMRVGGGGVFDTPPLLRTDALDYVTRRGSHQIAHIDDEHKFIFYRSL
jgi:hypothetical protein